MVAAILPVKRGISSPAVTSIPESWDRQWFRYFIDNFLANADIRNVASTSGITVSGNVSGNSTTGSSNTNVTIALTPIATSTVLGNVSGVAATPAAISQAQLTTLINNFTAILSGDVPPSGGGIVNFLRADGTWNIPAGSGPIPNNTVMGNVSGASAPPVPITQTQLTALINVFTSTLSGAVPASAGGVIKFLRADSTFAVPPTFTSAAPGYVPASGGGTANYLRADGTFAAVVIPVSANPTALVGPTAVNGTAATFMTSDSAPGINLAAAYTWGGVHTFNARIAAALGLTVSGGTFISRGISDSATALEMTITSTGAVTLAAPTSITDNTLTVNGASSAIALIVSSGVSGATGGADLKVVRSGGTANQAGRGANLFLNDSAGVTGYYLQNSGGQFELWSSVGGGPTLTQILKVLTTAEVVINAPASGTALTVTALAGVSPGLHTFGAGSGGGPIFTVVRNSTATGYTSARLYNDQNGGSRALEIDYSGSSYASQLVTNGPTGEQGTVGTTGAFPLTLYSNNTARVVIASTGSVTVLNALGINNATPPAQVTGWGTPTGPVVVANFPGASATLVQCSNAIAKLITDLKAFGLYGA